MGTLGVGSLEAICCVSVGLTRQSTMLSPVVDPSANIG